jgi:hypothetical protein
VEGRGFLIAASFRNAGDLYLAGRGMAPLNAPLLDWTSGGIHLSLADIFFLSAAALAAAITWRLTAGGRA